MITLKYPKESAQVKAWKDRLKEMVLGHELVEDLKLRQPILIDGDENLKGEEAINAHLDKIQGELKQWWYCSC